jgi:hypothetical protein
VSKLTCLAFGLSLAAAAGCGSSTDSLAGAGGAGSKTTTTTSSSGTGAGGSVDVPGSYSVEFGPVTVPSGTENTQCMVVSLKNAEQLRVGKIHNELSDGSHHVIIYRVADTEEKLTPYDCQPFSDTLDPTKGSPLMITQKKDDLLTLPKGVAFSLDPNQMIRIEMHYINATAKELEVHEKTTFIPIADAEFKDEASLLFLGDPDIDIAPHSSATLGPVYLPLPSNLSDIKFFGITGHAHQWGTNVKVATTDGKDGTDTSVYDVPNWQWSEPATVYADPPFQIPAGGGFRFSCEWNNQSDATVKFGESANDEMCFFWAYYYPSKGSFVCVHTDQVAGGYDLCCPGNPVCSKIFN